MSPPGAAEGPTIRAVPTDIPTFRRELSSLECTFSRWRTPGNFFEESSGVSETADDHPDGDHPPPAAAL
jgi:hypothetical protein